MKRRFFLLAAPVIVAAPSLMKVSTLPATLLRPAPGIIFMSNPSGPSWHTQMWLEEAAAIKEAVWQTCGITDLMRGGTPKDS